MAFLPYQFDSAWYLPPLFRGIQFGDAGADQLGLAETVAQAGFLVGHLDPTIHGNDKYRIRRFLEKQPELLFAGYNGKLGLLPERQVFYKFILLLVQVADQGIESLAESIDFLQPEMTIIQSPAIMQVRQLFDVPGKIK